ncbi:DoxX family protein [Taylorella equigenitalis]|nr:DoxX family protein [Taylorella equigenitalis]ASY41909.1 hypothetical protein CA943_02030 [Taylorella equigenitalis]KGK33054.1 membrane protein [Taylorella equigenitalis]RBA26222.1 DoxX family protein [Taylorella equigenitalis]WDU46779.1 DoxX family protein [Taylorella equigenitalis]
MQKGHLGGNMFYKSDFAIRGESFNLGNPWNILRIWSGLSFFPHALSKWVDGALNPGTLSFFAKAGFEPASTFVMIAFIAEMLAGIALVLGIATRWAAIGGAAVLFIAAYALVTVKGFAWTWNGGGIEYPIFWGITLLMIAFNEFKTRKYLGRDLYTNNSLR